MTGAAIFDLDATLVDSAAVAERAFSDAFERCGLAGDPPVNAFMSLSGTPLEQVCLDLVLPVGTFPHAFREASRERARELTLFPGVWDLLSLLHHHEILKGIITGKDRARTLETMKLLGIDHFFSCVVTPDDSPAPKPSPEGVLWICQELGTKTCESAVIGDSILDIRSGRQAGCLTIGCTWGIAGGEALKAEGADLIAESVAQLSDFMCDKFHIDRLAAS